MKSDDLDLLRVITPYAERTPELFTAQQREALFADVVSGTVVSGTHGTGTHGTGTQGTGTSGRRVRTWTYRLAPVAAAGTVAAVAVAMSGGGPASVPQGQPAGAGYRAASPDTQTVAYIRHRATAALAKMRSGTLRTTIIDSSGVTRYVDDLSSGADRHTFTSRQGKIIEDDSSPGTGPGATSTFVNYQARAWWTSKGGLAGPDFFKAPTLRQQLAAGALAVVGHDTVNGQQAIHLRYTKQMFKVNGKTYYSDIGDVWVNSATFLPIRMTGTGGKKFTVELSWSKQPPAPAEVTAVPPASFRHVPRAPQSVVWGTGKGVG